MIWTGGKMFNLDERMRARMQEIQERMVKEALFGERPPYSPFVSTATMRPSIAPSWSFHPTMPLLTIITSPYISKKRGRSRERKRGFWQRLWITLSDLNQWPYSPIEYYEVDVPSIIVDRASNQIICHPSLEREIKKAVSEGTYDPIKRR